jgi:hypothetical protein
VAGWTDGQVSEFARRFAAVYRPAWSAYVDHVREALIDSFVLGVILGQDKLGIDLGEVRSMHSRLSRILKLSHRMANPSANA